VEVIGSVNYITWNIIHTANNFHTGFTHPVPMLHTSGCHYSL